MLDDAVRKRVEPMAPSIESRFELVEQLVAAGHVVTVGVNPLTLDWVPDFEPLLNRIKDLGAWGAWIEVA
jgi:DNA repair photolyase